MDPKRQFSQNLELLGQLPSSGGREKAVASVFAALASRLSGEQRALVEAILPEWLRSQWTRNSPPLEQTNGLGVVEQVKSIGGYSYRGAAERVVNAVFASLAEALDDTAQQELGRALPEEFRILWEGARTCSLSETASQYL